MVAGPEINCGNHRGVEGQAKEELMCSLLSYCQPIQPASTQYDVGAVCVLKLTIVNLHQPVSMQCDVGAVCVPIDLLSTYFNLPQPSVMLIQCVSP